MVATKFSKIVLAFLVFYAFLLILPLQAAARSPFLVTDEIIMEDPAAGIHRYISPTLRIEAIRRHDEASKLIWTVVDIVSSGTDVFRVIPDDAASPMSRRGQHTVEEIGAANGAVLALSTDYASYRLAQGQIGGVVIRGGALYADEARHASSTVFPNLDLLALFADGDMKVFENGEKTGEELLAMGAVDVLAFGPILVSDGMINEEDVSRYGRYKEPRIGIGMVEKGHYKVIMVEGRQEDSRGVSTAGLAQMFADEGCTLAFNLDGGKTATLAFMGKQIVLVAGGKTMAARARRSNEILGIGYSPPIQEAE